MSPGQHRPHQPPAITPPEEGLQPPWLMSFADFVSCLLACFVLLFSMVAHEYAHGYAALKQGDTTAYALGRLTWNPIKHIDPFMTILLPLLVLAIPILDTTLVTIARIVEKRPVTPG